MVNLNNRAVFIEFSGEAGLLDKAGLLRGEGIHRVCLTPIAAYELEVLNLDYIFPHQKVSSLEIQFELNDNWAKLEELVSLINDWIPFGRNVASYLKVLLDSCMEKIIQLAIVLKSMQPDQIFFFQTNSLDLDFSLTFDEQESLYSLLLPHVCKVYSPNSVLTYLPRPKGRRKLSHLIKIHSNFKRKLGMFYQDLKIELKFCRRSKSVSSICFVEGGYGLASAMDLLTSRYRVVPWNPSGPLILPLGFGLRWGIELLKIPRIPHRYKKKCGNAWQKCQHSSRLKLLLSCRGVDFFEVVSSRLEYMFKKIFPRLFVIEIISYGYFKRRNVVCLVSSYFSHPNTYTLAQTAKTLSIPVVTMQHSSYGYWDWPMAKYTDGLMSDYKLTGGHGVTKYVAKDEDSGCSPITTGLISLDNIMKEPATLCKKKEKPKIVYPLASYVKNFIHYTNSRLTLTEYFEINRRILQVLGKFPELDVIVRPHPARQFRENVEAIKSWVRHQKWDHICFETDGSAIKTMQGADLIIIDSPSTVLLHAVTTDVKILVFNRIFKMLEEGLTALKKRVFYSEDLDAFVKRLEEILVTQDFDNAQYKNDEFLCQYGTYKNDGSSLNRVVEAIRQVAARKTAPN